MADAANARQAGAATPPASADTGLPRAARGTAAAGKGPLRRIFKRLVPNSLMGRALLIVVTPLIVMQVLSAYVFYESHWDQVSKKLARGLAGEIALMLAALEEVDDPQARSWLFREAAQLQDLVVTTEPGGILPNVLQQQSQLEGELRRALLYRGLTNPFHVDAQSDPGAVEVAIQRPEGVLRIVAPRTRLFSWTTYVFVLWMAGTSLLLLGFAAIFMRNQVRPVKRLARAADAFGKGRDYPGFRPEGGREVRLAGRAFLAMKNRIQRQINQRTVMLAGVSHDLRTPLTRMKLQLEMMRATKASGALKDDVAEMERMLEGYLAFARGEGAERAEPCDLKTLLEDATWRVRRDGSKLTLSTEGDLVLPLKRVAMTRTLNNLIENALRCAGSVDIRASRRGREIEVVVDDDGPGIPREQRERVFKPFYRLDGSRNPVTGGVGLGLTIARDVARGHGGDLVLEDSPLGGLRARLRLPL
jgi:two-component system osmolarity sensor histidine kinase EnvZ